MANFMISFVRNALKRFKKSGKKTSEKETSQGDLRGKQEKPSLTGKSNRPGEPSPLQTKRRRRNRRRKPQPPQGGQLPAQQGEGKEKTHWDISQFRVEPAEGKTRFQDLHLPNSILHAIADLGFRYCTPIQAAILPATLSGRDAAGQAQTGTGKTAAFLITIFTRILRQRVQGKRPPGTPRALILAPTRELVLQIAKDAADLSKYTPIKVATIFGGMHYQRQKQQLEGKTVDVIVATPGRLLDFQKQKIVDLSQVEILVIDEADRMLDMGFIPDVRQIINSTPHKEQRQTLFFSATLTDEVQRLSKNWTRDPLVVEIQPEQVAADTVDQVIYIVTSKEKYALLYNIITRQNLHRVLVFCNRKDETRKLANMFSRYGINNAVLSGDVPQQKRLRTLEDFKEGKIRVLVATDVAGRGLHIEAMSHVINYTLPHDPEDYVHRIGRTGRAGESGTSISFACEEDAFQLPKIQEFLGRELPCIQPQEDWLKLPPPVQPPAAPNHPNPERRSRPRRNRQRRRN